MKLATTLAALVLDTSAPAATFDFADYAATHGEGSWREITGGSLTRDGVTVRGFGGGRAGSVAFLDAPTARGPAGLGVCSSWSCTTGVAGANVADDNISRARKVLGTMSRRIVANKIIMGGIAAFLLAANASGSFGLDR